MKHIQNFDTFINEGLTLFGDMDDYVDKFSHMSDFKTGEILPHVSGTPKEFPDVDSKGNWRTDGWNYTLVRSYTAHNFKTARDVLKFCYDNVIAPNKKEWIATNVRKPDTLFSMNKNDVFQAYEKPGLGFIFFTVFDNSTDYSRERHAPIEKSTYQVQGMFMNAETYMGEIEKYPQLKAGIDDLMQSIKHNDKAIEALINYIKTYYF